MDVVLRQTVNAVALGGTCAGLAPALALLPSRAESPITTAGEVLR